jgi:hypothetical protein
MSYKTYVEIIKLENITDELTIEPSENYDSSFTFTPSYYQTILPSTVYSTREYNDDYKETFLIVFFSSVAGVLFILFVLWYKYNMKKNVIKSISKEKIYRKSFIESLDEEFGTRQILDDN